MVIARQGEVSRSNGYIPQGPINILVMYREISCDPKLAEVVAKCNYRFPMARNEGESRSKLEGDEGQPTPKARWAASKHLQGQRTSQSPSIFALQPPAEWTFSDQSTGRTGSKGSKRPKRRRQAATIYSNWLAMRPTSQRDLNWRPYCTNSIKTRKWLAVCVSCACAPRACV